MTQLRTEPATQACALTGDGTGDLSVYGTVLQPTAPQQPGRGGALTYLFYFPPVKKKLQEDGTTSVLLMILSPEPRTVPGR